MQDFEFNELNYVIGKQSTCSRDFESGKEYIHFVTKEIFHDVRGRIEKIRVDQLTCLEDYLQGKEVTKVERTLIVSELTPIF